MLSYGLQKAIRYGIIYLNILILGKQYIAAFANGVIDEILLNMFHDLNADANYENLSIDSTSVKVPQHSKGAKKVQYLTM